MQPTSARVAVHRSFQSLRWGDMDALGHVNNTLYFRYMEQARIEWIYAQSKSGKGYAGETGPLIVNASCTFFTPLEYPADIEVQMYLGEPGRTSIGSYYDILRGGERVAEGAARIVWVDLASGRSTPLPETIHALLSVADSR